MSEKSPNPIKWKGKFWWLPTLRSMLKEDDGTPAKIVTSVNGQTGDVTVETSPPAAEGVTSYNGKTGAVTGVESYNGKTGIVTGVESFNGKSGAVTGVASFNGATGAVTGVASINGKTGAVEIDSGTKIIKITLNGSNFTKTVDPFFKTTNVTPLTSAGIKDANQLYARLVGIYGLIYTTDSPNESRIVSITDLIYDSTGFSFGLTGFFSNLLNPISISNVLIYVI